MISLKSVILLTVLLIINFGTTVNAQVWDSILKIETIDKSGNDEFGGCVKIVEDMAFVGATGEDGDTTSMNILSNAGAAYVFQRDSNNQWLESFKIFPSDRFNEDLFGTALDYEDGFLGVSAIQEDHDTAGANYRNASGSVYMFKKLPNGSWSEIQKLVAFDRDNFDRFGNAISMDSNVAVIAAKDEDHDLSGNNQKSSSGSVYVFERDPFGNWSGNLKLVANDRDQGDYFGTSVDLYRSQIAIGAQGDEHDTSGMDSLFNAGSVYIFERNQNHNWAQVQKIVPPDRNANDVFGYSVAMNDQWLAIGSPYNSLDSLSLNTFNSAGAVYLYQKDTSGLWNYHQKVVSRDRDSNDLFGYDISLSDSILLVGTQESTIIPTQVVNYSHGSAYFFKLNSSNEWKQIKKVQHSLPIENEKLGCSVSLDNDQAIIGAKGNNQSLSGSGSVYNGGAAYIISSDTTGVPSNISIEENRLVLGVYPNPTHDNVHLEWLNGDSNSQIEIMNGNGQSLELISIQNKNHCELNLPSKAGIYFIKVTSGDQISKAVKVIKL